MEEVVNKMRDLFITWRKYFIEQKEDGSYQRIDRYAFYNGLLFKHLKGKNTYGIFCGEYNSKFISFDVDTKETAEIDVRHLVNVLENDFNLARKDIHVSLSGNKGYHVDIYFSDTISPNMLKRFYYDVIQRAGFSSNEVELRPLHKIGMKLPLGVHKVTGKRCWYIDNQTFKPIENINYILTIEQIDPSVIVSEYSDYDPIILKQDKVDEIERVIDSTVTSTFRIEEHLEHVYYVLENNCLKHKASRNNMTLTIAMYLKDDMDYTEQESFELITSIMLNTKRTRPDLISMNIDNIPSETRRVVHTVYKNNYKLECRRKNVLITREDIETILSIKKWHLKQLYFIHLVQAKRYAKKNGTYYMSYRMMSKMGTTYNRSRLRFQIAELEELELMTVVESNVINFEESKLARHLICYPNKYRLNLDTKKIFNQDIDGIEIKDEEDITLEQILRMFEERYDMKFKKILPRKQFEKIHKVV